MAECKNKDYMAYIAMTIKYFLDEKKMTAKELSKKSGVSEATISRLVNKKQKDSATEIILALCDGFEVSTKEFFDVYEIFHRQ